ncbi:MAG: hypothetical protein PVI06_10955 [Desulfobacterales bacterium]
MKKDIVVVDSDTKHCQSLCRILENHHYKATTVSTTSDLEKYIQSTECRIALIDLDNLPVDKHFFRDLKLKNPALCILGLSVRTFHPELEEVIGRHIFACLKKPVDPEELVFLLKSHYDNYSNIDNETRT